MSSHQEEQARTEPTKGISGDLGPVNTTTIFAGTLTGGLVTLWSDFGNGTLAQWLGALCLLGWIIGLLVVVYLVGRRDGTATQPVAALKAGLALAWNYKPYAIFILVMTAMVAFTAYSRAKHASGEAGVMQSLLAAVAGAKRETSDDPRKELANLGVPWDRHAMAKAFDGIGDPRVAKLFFEGGMPLTGYELHRLLKSRSDAVKGLLTQHPMLVDAEACRVAFLLWEAPSVVQAGAQDEALVRALCRRPEALPVVQPAVQAELQKQQEYHAEARAAYEQALAARMPVSECLRTTLRNGGRPLVAEAMAVPVTAVGSTQRDRLLRDVNIQLMAGNDDLRPVVEAYCQRQAEEVPNISTDDTLLRKWQRLAAWVN